MGSLLFGSVGVESCRVYAVGRLKKPIGVLYAGFLKWRRAALPAVWLAAPGNKKAGSKPTASGEAGSAPKTAETAVSVDPAKGQLVRVVSSFSVLGDMTREIGGERVQVENLVGIDQDPHVSADAAGFAKIKNAQYS